MPPPPEEAARLLRGYDPAASLPSWAIRFAASQEQVRVVLSGMSSLEQMADNTGYMEEFSPLNEEERALVFQAADIIRGDGTIPCTACSYCTAGCPQSIPIPDLFALYNRCVLTPGDYREEYEALTRNGGKASSCLYCGQCRKACPQRLDVIGCLKSVYAVFEG